MEAFRTLPDWLSAPLRSAINDASRWQFEPVRPENVGGYCIPREDEDGRAAIVYRYAKTVDDPVYMAHELGHLVSDDLLNAAGFNYRDAPAHVREVPAFYAQHLMYDYLKNHGPYELRAAAAAHQRKEAREQLIDIAIGASAREAESHKGAGPQAIQESFIASMRSWLGDVWSTCPKADRIADRIADPEIRAETQEVFLHTHATASMLAAALYARQKVLQPVKRLELLATMFGRTGPYRAEDLLRIIDAEDGPQAATLILAGANTLWSGQKPRVNVVPSTDPHP